MVRSALSGLIVYRCFLALIVGSLTLALRPAEAATVGVLHLSPSSLAIPIDCKGIWGDQVCRELEKRGKKHKSEAHKSGGNKKAEAKKQGKEKGTASSTSSDVDPPPTSEKPAQPSTNNDEVLWGDYYTSPQQ